MRCELTLTCVYLHAVLPTALLLSLPTLVLHCPLQFSPSRVSRCGLPRSLSQHCATDLQASLSTVNCTVTGGGQESARQWAASEAGRTDGLGTCKTVRRLSGEGYKSTQRAADRLSRPARKGYNPSRNCSAAAGWAAAGPTGELLQRPLRQSSSNGRTLQHSGEAGAGEAQVGWMGKALLGLRCSFPRPYIQSYIAEAVRRHIAAGTVPSSWSNNNRPPQRPRRKAAPAPASNVSQRVAAGHL